MLSKIQFQNKIKELFFSLFSQYKKNKLIVALYHSFHLIDKELLEIYCKLYNFLIDNYSNSIDPDLLLHIITFSLGNLISISCIFNLKHMIDKNMCNSIPSLHVIYGENITQLVSFSLTVELNKLILNQQFSYKKKEYIFNELKLNYNDYDLIKKINNENKKQLLKNKLHLTKKQILQTSLKIFHLLLFEVNSIKDETFDIVTELILSSSTENKFIKKENDTQNEFLWNCVNLFTNK